MDEAGFTSAPTSLISLPDPLTLLDLGHGTGRLAFDVQAALPCIRRIIGIELDPIVCDISRFVRDKLVTNLMKKASQLSPSSSSQSKSKRSDNDNESRESDLDRNHDHDSGGETDDGDNGDGGNGGSDLADLIPLPDTLFHQGDILKIDTYEGTVQK